MTCATFKRYELKYLLTQDQYLAILPVIRENMSPDHYCKNGENYSIFNIYYDTVDSRLIRTSLQKPYHKEKLRLRSYDSPARPDSKVFLEIKKKTGSLVHKRRAKMTWEESLTFLEKGIIPHSASYIDQQVVKEISYFLSQNRVSPAAFIGYRRLAYVGKVDKSFRITFDFDIKTRRDGLRLDMPFFGQELLPGNTCLMEIKIRDAVPIWLASLLSENQIYRTGFSKYGTEYRRSMDQCYTR
jgi:hypothetical protein